MNRTFWSKEFVAIVGSSLFMSWAYYALIPTLPMYLTKTLGISHHNIGMAMTIFYVTAILVRPISGYLLDNYHRSSILIASLVLMTGGYGMYPLIGNVSTLFPLMFMHGAAWGLCTSAGAPIIADIVPFSQIGQGIGIYAVTVPIGMTIGPMFGLSILKYRGSNAMFLATLGVSCLALLGACCARTPYKPAAKKKFSLASSFSREVLPISFCMFFIMIAYGAIIVFVGIYAAQKNFSNVPSFFLCFSAMVFLSRLSAGRLFDSGHFAPLMLTGFALTAAGMFWLGHAGNGMEFLESAAFCGSGLGTLMPSSQAAVSSLVEPGRRGAANSTYLISYDLGIAVGSCTIGFLSDMISLGRIFQLITLLVLLSAGIFVFKALPHYRRNRENGRATP